MNIGSIFLIYIQPPSIKFLFTITIIITISYSKELLNLIKTYINKEKYNGYNNSFIFKLAIFHNIYLKANFLLKAKMKAFSTIFKSLALNYYYSNVSTNSAINFDQVCNFIRNYFENAKYK